MELKGDTVFMVSFVDTTDEVAKQPTGPRLDKVRDGNKGEAGKVLLDKEVTVGDREAPRPRHPDRDARRVHPQPHRDRGQSPLSGDGPGAEGGRHLALRGQVHRVVRSHQVRSRLRFALTLLVLLAGGHAFAADEKYVSKDGRFTVVFPAGEVKENTVGTGLKSKQSILTAKERTFEVIYADLPAEAKKLTTKQLFDAGEKGAIKGEGKKLAASIDFTFGPDKLPARDHGEGRRSRRPRGDDLQGRAPTSSR